MVLRNKIFSLLFGEFAKFSVGNTNNGVLQFICTFGKVAVSAAAAIPKRPIQIKGC